MLKNDKQNEITVKMNVIVTDQDLVDILDIAFEGGINYWVEGIRVPNKEKGMYIAESIVSGKTAVIDIEDEDVQQFLTKEKLLQGVKQYIEWKNRPYNILDGMGGIDTCDVDAEVADCIIQFALFGDIRYA